MRFINPQFLALLPVAVPRRRRVSAERAKAARRAARELGDRPGPGNDLSRIC